MNTIWFKEFLFLLIYICHLFKTHETNDDNYINEFVVKCPGGYSEAKSVALQMGFILDHKMIGLDDYFVFKHKSNRNGKLKFHTHRLKRSTKVSWVEQQVKLVRVKRDVTSITSPIKFIDPLYSKQWYLMRSQINPYQIDMNVIEAWQLGYTGKNVVISILDDGIDYRHEDLRDNYDPSASYDINGKDNDPLPNLSSLENRHGTRCAGEVSAKANNSKCGIGIAFNSKIGAVRMLDGEVTDRVEAEALSFKQQHIDIYSGSWGPDDNGQKVEGPAKLAKEAFERGTKYGRNGLGNIYVWASGNGGKRKDSCACDGYASSIYTISISSVSEFNRKPWYLESCASTLASTYSSGSSIERKIISTDLNNMCATDHTGTSASAPLAAGIIALLLEANRNLTWRDVQYIIVITANPVPIINGQFIVNGANRKVSNLYGFGLMDTGKIVRLGRLWHALPPQHICTVSYNGERRVLQGRFKEQLSITTDGCSGKNKVNYIEHVIVHLTMEFQRRGDLRIHLISPSGTKSEILPFRVYDYESGPTTFDVWPLMSVQFWGESASGVWKIVVDNGKSSNKNYKGLLSSFQLEIFGTDKWPVRLKSPSTSETDRWFQKFERFVVDDVTENVEVKSHAHIRTHADTSDNEFTKENIECDEECFNNTCSAPGPQFCDSCNNFKGFKNTCVAKCPPGSFVRNNSTNCEPCHFSCSECFGPEKYNCSRCHDGDQFIRKTNQCQMSLQKCQAGYFKGSKSCTKCPEHCSICTSSTQCSKCNQSFVLTLQSQCRSKCDIGSYSDLRDNCRVCHIDCLSCVNGDSWGCTSCNHDSFINSKSNNVSIGKCVSKCPFGYYTNHTIGFCYRCHQDCKTCTGPSSAMCTDCIPPMELSETGHTCIDPVSYNCKPNEFKSSIGSCEKCPTDCQTCVEGRCTSCPTNKYYFNKSCVSQCPTGFFLHSQINTCLSCEVYCDSCNKSTSIKECVHCSQNLNPCNMSCSIGEFWNFGKRICEKCHSSCKTCIGNSDKNCTSCIDKDYRISFGKCVKSCSFGEFSLKFQSQSHCVSCNPSCQNISCDVENGKCLSCPYGHKFTSKGLCERNITCSISEYWNKDQKSCYSCDTSCRSCSQKGLCNSCPRNFCLDFRLSICRPCCQSFSSNKNCSQCLFNRELCVEDSSPTVSLIPFDPLKIFLILIIVFSLLFIILFWYFETGKTILSKFCDKRTNKSGVKYQKIENSIDFINSNETIYSTDDDNEVHFTNSNIPTRESRPSEISAPHDKDVITVNSVLPSPPAGNLSANGHTNVES